MAGLIAWAEFLECGNRTVDMTQITSAVTVSTVFLGLDHRFSAGPPHPTVERTTEDQRLEYQRWLFVLG
jgi:hypothetical protein